jgi:TPR repeat protein
MRAVLLALAPVLALVCGSAAMADTIEDGVNAAISGDYPTALALLVAGADRGDPRAEFFLGILYESGTGVTKDVEKAARFYRLSAAQGLAPAQNNLGSLYATGDGVAQDLPEAMKWWMLAAEQGLPVAQTNLAAFYATGTAIPQDLVQAYKWSALAAAQGYADAEEILATITMMISPEELVSAKRLVQAWHPAETTGA